MSERPVGSSDELRLIAPPLVVIANRTLHPSTSTTNALALPYLIS